MASLQGLPPLPKSLSGLLNFSSTQWKELERLHAMRTMIQQDLNRGIAERSTLQRGQADDRSDSEHGSSASSTQGPSRTSRLDVQLALLRKEMVGLRQLDMSLLCQLWSLNEAIQEYKQLVQERMSLSLSPSHASSPGWDNGLESPSSEGEMNSKSFELEKSSSKVTGMPGHQDLDSVPEKLSSAESSSHSSLEFGDI